MNSYHHLKLVLDPRGVLCVRLNRPELRNAFNEEMIVELTSVFSREAVEENVRLVILRGEGSVFCAGGDLNWMKKSVELTREENVKDAHALIGMLKLINECPKPLLGLVHGAAMGGGVGLVSVCDFVIATQDTFFSLSEVRLGLIPACIGPFVIAKIGPSHARRFFLSAERMKADKAYEIDLIHEVAPSVESLEEMAENWITQILESGPKAVAAAKKLVLDLSIQEDRARLKNPLEHVAEILAELRASPEGQEGVRAFFEKRKPRWWKS